MFCIEGAQNKQMSNESESAEVQVKRSHARSVSVRLCVKLGADCGIGVTRAVDFWSSLCGSKFNE